MFEELLERWERQASACHRQQSSMSQSPNSINRMMAVDIAGRRDQLRECISQLKEAIEALQVTAATIEQE